MNTTISTKGQTIIPAALRRKYGLKPNSRLAWIDEGNALRVVPLPDDPITALKGSLKGGDSLTEALLVNRKKDRAHEDAGV